MIILGSTGSIGTQTLDVIAHLNGPTARGGDRWEVVGLAAGNNAARLKEQAARFGVRAVACAGGAEAGWLTGADAAERLVRTVECDVVVAAMVGVAGLPATLAAVELGRDVALANKETLVAAGALVVPAAARSGARLLPVDSEHAGAWQCLGACLGGPPPAACPAAVTRVVLTASGGPFRTTPADRLAGVTPEQALRHPTWTMGRKVTIDSATLMNKALELIEAHWLFGLAPERLGAVIHPQSIVHAVVEFADGTSLAQMAAPDMRSPIQAALTWPARRGGLTPRVDLASVGRLEFEAVDAEKFPAPALARRAMEAGGTAGAVLNAANEEAVRAFLEGAGVAFPRIAALAAEAMDAVPAGEMRTLEDCLKADAAAREFVRERVGAASAGRAR